MYKIALVLISPRLHQKRHLLWNTVLWTRRAERLLKGFNRLCCISSDKISCRSTEQAPSVERSLQALLSFYLGSEHTTEFCPFIPPEVQTAVKKQRKIDKAKLLVEKPRVPYGSRKLLYFKQRPVDHYPTPSNQKLCAFAGEILAAGQLQISRNVVRVN